MIVSRGINIVAVFSLFCMLAAGCATTEKITDDIIGKGETLKKKVAFLPTVNNSGFGGEDFQKAAMAQLKACLDQRCDALRVVHSEKIREALEDIPHLDSGQIDHLALAALGRSYGLNAAVEETIIEIECVTEKCGIWGFKRPCMLARSFFRVRAYDIETTAVIFDGIVRDALEISEYERQSIEKGAGYDKDMAARILAKATPKIAKLICEGFAEEPWKGFITSSSDNTFTIAAGEDVGLARGDVLEVFGMGEPIKGQGDQVYLVSGPKLGEIKVTNVQRDLAEAVGLFGHDLKNSCCVKMKP